MNIVSISLPNVQTIQQEFFKDCVKLNDVEINDATKICHSSFKGCKSLEHQNDEIAQCHLGFIYLNSESPLHDVEKRIHYLTLASNQNNLYCQGYLGFLNGEFGQPDIDKAIHF